VHGIVPNQALPARQRVPFHTTPMQHGWSQRGRQDDRRARQEFEILAGLPHVLNHLRASTINDGGSERAQNDRVALSTAAAYPDGGGASAPTMQRKQGGKSQSGAGHADRVT
jgi:hypothetical protein